jgi:tetratricopeptide (TPR) repeat protein
LGLVLLAAGLAAGTAAALWLAWRPDPDEVYESALAALEAGRFEKAGAALDRLARLRTPTVLDRGVRARLDIARGRIDDAVAALGTIPDDHPLASWAALRVGQLERQRHRLRFAERALKHALQLDPGLIDARRELIYILGVQLRRRELGSAFTALAARSTLTAHEVWVWCLLHDLAWWTPAELALVLRPALRADPADRWSRLALAESEHRQGHLRESETLLAPLPADDPDACAARARIALERSGPEAAAALLAAGPEDHPDLATLRGRLALARGDGPAAVRCFERALAADPGRRRSLADLGHAWQVAGRPEKARPYLDAAARLDALNNLLLKAEDQTARPDPDLWRRLASACEDAGLPAEARAWYTLVVAHDPLDTAAQHALFRLGTGSRKAVPSS